MTTTTTHTIELVTIETMPATSASTRTTERTRDEADEIIAGDETGYAHEVSSRTVQVIDGYRLADPDEVDEPTDESAEEWYDSLGYHVSTDDGDVVHPVCAMGEVDTYQPQSDAERDLLVYARAARSVAQAVEAELRRAVDAWRARDLSACVTALREASSLEKEYGDDPAARVLRDTLLVEVE